MGLRERLGKLFGKQDAAGNTPLAAARERAQRMRGRETGQSTGEQDGTRQRMEAELDAQRATRAGAASPTEGACPHTVLLPRWDNAADMGHEDRVSSYTCEACQAQFTAAAGAALRQTEAERVRQRLEN